MAKKEKAKQAETDNTARLPRYRNIAAFGPSESNMNTHELHPEEGFLLALVTFAIEEWGLQNVSLRCPANWNVHLLPLGVRCDFTTDAVITLKIDCGTHCLTYCTLPSSDTPGFFASVSPGRAPHNEGMLDLFAE